MSSGPKPIPDAATHNHPAPGSDNQLSFGVSIGEYSSQKSSRLPMEDPLAAGENSKNMMTLSSQPIDPPSKGSPDAGSATSETEADKGRASSRSRRSRSIGENNNEGTRIKDQDSSANNSDLPEERSPYIDALASTLARLDEEAYKKAVLQDANAILEQLILPMSFPWAHPVGPVVRTIPRDIDEMPAIQMIANAEHEVCSLKHNNFDLTRRDLSDSEDRDALSDEEADFRAVARRADDPGVVELLTCAKPLISNGNDTSLTSVARKSSILLKDAVAETSGGHGSHANLQAALMMDIKTPGELSYRVFKQVQDSKRRKLEAGTARLKTSIISFKVGSTSSRPHLYNKSDSQARMPLLLPAELPHDFRPIVKGRNKDRIPPGRSQLVWMEKVSSRTSHRVAFKSYITNEKVEAGLQKRPRDVLVGIRVNGKLLTSPSITNDDIVQAQAGGSSKRKRDGKSSSVYNAKYVSEALEEACGGTEPRMGARQCSMDTELFTRKVLSSEANRDKSMGWNSKSSIKSLNVIYVTPRIDCFPTEDGLVHVLCSSPGELQPTHVEAIFNGASKKALARECTVCWRGISMSGEMVSECSECGILVHGKCCQSADTSCSPQWKCNICTEVVKPTVLPTGSRQATSLTPSPSENAARRSARVKDGSAPSQGKNTPCCLCPHKGGSMSTILRGRQTAWAHDVCRIWCDQGDQVHETDKEKNGGNGVLMCALCGTSTVAGDDNGSNGIIKCGASGCSIHFHPMCALVLSKYENVRMEEPNTDEEPNGKDAIKQAQLVAPSPDRRLETLVEDDKYLCRQFSLRFVKVAIPGDSAELPQPPVSSVLPVCFCGVHNPRRDRSLYGLYPGGKYIDEQVMRIPPKKSES